MCKSELYRQILNTVSQETEISCNELLSTSRRAEVVDARCVLVYFLSEQGLNTAEIASRINRSQQAVRRLKNLYTVRAR